MSELFGYQGTILRVDLTKSTLKPESSNEADRKNYIGGAAGTSFFADPKEKLLAICFTQIFNVMMMPENNYQEEFERLVYQALI